MKPLTFDIAGKSTHFYYETYEPPLAYTKDLKASEGSALHASVAYYCGIGAVDDR